MADIQCEYCGKPITGKYLIVDGKSYHEVCFREHVQIRCDYCDKPIDGQHNVMDGKHYHIECYRDHILAKCDICGEPLIGEYYNDYWGNAFHAFHRQELHECNSCGRLICESLTGGGFSLNDGRYICSLCNESSVEDTYVVETSLSYVRDLLAYHGIDGLPREIPISLVNKTTLRSISKTYSDAMQGFTDHSAQTRNGEIISRNSHIYILTGLPLIMFRAVLAHELMHIYLFENDLDLRSDIREGFCNLGSELVYQADNSRYSKFRLSSMMADRDPDYGLGYQKMSKLLDDRGWGYLLENLATIR
ncbi:MAG: protein DA1 [Candidatus Marinimicrobia bacterium]|nr:protein DA1 [Candidatus Neomarinimicrobiota bacterium]